MDILRLSPRSDLPAHRFGPHARLPSGEPHRCATGFSNPCELSAMGWKLTALVFLFALLALNVGALAVGVPILVFLLYRFWSNRQAKPGAGRSHWMIYLGAFFIFLSIVAVAESGTHSPVVFGAAGVSLLTLGLFPGVFQGLAEKFSPPVAEMFGAAGGRKPEGRVACVGLTAVPLGYLDPEKAEPKEALLRFQRLAQTLAELGSSVEMRLDFADGAGRVLFVADGGEEAAASGLLEVVRSQLPEFRAALLDAEAEDGTCSVAIEGVPEPSPDPLGPLAKYFVENRLSGGYTVKLSPAWVNPVARWLAGWKQRRTAARAGHQDVDDGRTTTVVDHPKQVELEDSVRGLDRLLARRPLRVSVVVSAADQRSASYAAGVLVGALSSQRGIDGLKVRRARRVGRSGWRRSTLMLPSEAAPYLWLPRMSLGMRVAPSAEFHEPPPSEGEVALGEVVALSGRNGRQVRIALDQLARHLFVTGATGSGKTRSCFSLLLQLHRMRVPFLVVEPPKSEYRSLLTAIPDLQVFTLGDEGTAPFRLNIFEPPPGVRVQAHLDNLVAAWNASFVSYSPVQYVVPKVFLEAYRGCGWDLASDSHGRPVTLDDVQAQVAKVCRGLGYEPRVLMDVEGAISLRLGNLTVGAKGALFGAESSTPLEALLGRPTVVELQHIGNDEEKAFVASLLLMNMAGWFQARGLSKRLRHLTLIEEAHRLIPNISTEKGDAEAADPRRRMVEQFGNMLAEMRAYGEGLVVVDQSPVKVLRDAIRNSATKVVHRVADSADKELLAGSMNATKEQAEAFLALSPGEAVVSVEGHPAPVRVAVDDVVSRMAIPLGEVTDGDVRRRMRSFYIEHPLPADRPAEREEKTRRVVGSEEFRAGFVAAYRVWVKSGETGPLRDFVLQAAAGVAGEGRAEAASRILCRATELYLPFNAEQREEFPRLFRKELEVGLRA